MSKENKQTNNKEKISNKKNSTVLSRRTVLRGLGAQLALPWLPSLAWATDPASEKAPAPKRFGVFFMSDGICPEHWWARPSSTGLQLGQCLQPLMRHRDSCTFIDGLYNQNSLQADAHPGQTGNILSGVRLKIGPVIQAAQSLDQLLADRWRGRTLLDSLVVSCELADTGFESNGYSTLYSSHISWRNQVDPVPQQRFPARIWDALFEQRDSQQMRSVLDRCSGHLKHTQRQLGMHDQRVLDAYLESVHELEKQVQHSETMRQLAQARSEKINAHMPCPPSGIPDRLDEHTKILLDLIVIALQTDRTRITTMMFNRDLSLLTYDFMGIPDEHHILSHRSDSDEYQRIVTFTVEQFAYLLDRLKEIPEGDGTLLDHCGLLFINSLWDGNKHDSHKVPVVVAGGASGSKQHHRALSYAKEPNDNRRLCSLYLNMLQALDAPESTFGDTNKSLSGY